MEQQLDEQVHDDDDDAIFGFAGWSVNTIGGAKILLLVPARGRSRILRFAYFTEGLILSGENDVQ